MGGVAPRTNENTVAALVQALSLAQVDYFTMACDRPVRQLGPSHLA
ncbi:hypothetical protein Hanom_Chr11g00991811 [Helianthus anomalus]